MKHSARLRTTVLTAAAVSGMLALTACGAAETGASGGGEEVTLAEPSWVGAQANVAVAKKLLEDEFDVRVDVRRLDEPAAFDALHSGKADAILEDWAGVPKKEKLYVEEKKTVVAGGGLGVEGHIGWYVPAYYAEENPDILDWKNLDDHWKDFRTTESGEKGQFLGAAPSYTTHDEELIRNLDLDFKVVPTGSEAAALKEIERLYKAEKPFISYWYQPQWMNAEIDMVEVKLPPYEEGCLEPVADAECGYDTLMLQKYFNADFAKDGGEAAAFLKNFRWETADQNEVAQLIAGEDMDPEDAAAKWIADNKSTWEKWLPKK